MTKGIKGSRKPDMTVTARRPALRPSRGEGSGDLLKSVPDSILRTLGGTHLEREATEQHWDDDAQDYVSVPSIKREFITHDMVHHEMKWRNLI